MGSSNLLDLLRTRTAVDCDTLNTEIGQTLGPFHDCTSNQAIAYHELQNPRHETLLEDSIQSAKNLAATDFDKLSATELAVEISMVSLSLLMAPFTTGYIHVQTNPFHAYSTQKTIDNARRLIWLLRYLHPSFDLSRLCIKIPSTWEGLQACKPLAAEGIATLATTLFAPAQVVMAGRVGCRYVAPYVWELKVQTESGYKSPSEPLLELCVAAQKYYGAVGQRTRVLPASLTTVEEVMALAGVDHITVAPRLLTELATAQSDDGGGAAVLVSLFDKEVEEEIPPDWESLVDDEAAFRVAMARDRGGVSEGKLAQAVSIFCDFQVKLEEMMGARGAGRK